MFGPCPELMADLVYVGIASPSAPSRMCRRAGRTIEDWSLRTVPNVPVAAIVANGPPTARSPIWCLATRFDTIRYCVRESNRNGPPDRRSMEISASVAQQIEAQFCYGRACCAGGGQKAAGGGRGGGTVPPAGECPHKTSPPMARTRQRNHCRFVGAIAARLGHGLL